MINLAKLKTSAVITTVAITAIVMVCVLACLCACTQPSHEEKTGDVTISATIKKDAKFDAPDLDVNAEDFEKAGFLFGDSCDVEFSNGLKLNDIPYFNGYYVKTGSPVIVAYPKNDYIIIAYNNRNMWSTEGLNDGDTVKITRKEQGKFKTTQDALSQTYSVDRNDYKTDEQFSNFRTLKGGNLKENFLFRGASPYDNSRGRASITNTLVESAQVKTIIDLADTEDELKTYFADNSFNSSYAKNLYDEGKVAALGMSSNQDSDEFKASLAKGVRLLINNGGPAYIHCMEGKDRTGFVCMLIEALAGASYDEMRDDYMQTYANYYGITKDSDSEKYNAICSLYFDTFCEYLSGVSGADSLKTFSYDNSAETYLKSCGLSDKEISELKELITK